VPDGTLVFHIILIWIMVAVLNRTLFKPINQILADREKKTQGRMSETQEVIRRVNARVQEYEGQLREARTEGYRDMERTRAESIRDRDQRVLGLKDEMGNWVSEQKAELSQQVEVVRQRLAVESSEVGSEIAARILGRPTSGSSN
jgi:F-type H+-transporting ATPase subunit b